MNKKQLISHLYQRIMELDEWVILHRKTENTGKLKITHDTLSLNVSMMRYLNASFSYSMPALYQ